MVADAEKTGMITADDRNFDVALVLGGGNALGAYQGGAYQALHERGLAPDWVVGASVGSVNGAIICGNPIDRRIAQLESWWNVSGPAIADVRQSPAMLDEARRTGAALWTVATGRTGLFAPRHLFGPAWNPFGNAEPASLYDTSPMRASLEAAIDFDLLNSGTPRFCATAVDVETGEDVMFTAGAQRLGPDQLRASSALLPAFPPVEIAGRLLADAGVSANLPLDAVLDAPRVRPLLCVAVDLLPLRAPRPQTLGEAAIRMQDLMFATQSRRSIAAWEAIFAARGDDAAPVTLLHLAYSGEGREVSGKAFDFSPTSAAARWRAGHRDLGRALAGLDARPAATPGLSVFGLAGANRDLTPIRWHLAPTSLTPPDSGTTTISEDVALPT
jgi:NTE family protein